MKDVQETICQNVTQVATILLNLQETVGGEKEIIMNLLNPDTTKN